MQLLNGEEHVKACKAAAAFALDIKPDDLAGFIIIGVNHDGKVSLVTNLCCDQHLLEMLGDASIMIMMENSPYPVSEN